MGVILSKIRKSAVLNDQLEIFKLKMDHFEEIFDWLSLEDLLALSQTCNRMKRIVGYYVKTKYITTEFVFEKDGIHLANRRCKGNGLGPFLKKLTFYELENIKQDRRNRKCGKSERIIPHIEAHQFKSLTEIHFHAVHFTDSGISRIKEILGQLEAVEIWISDFCCESNEFYESFLQFCTNIKRLYIQDSQNPRNSGNKSIIGADNSWLIRKYSTLEHLELTSEEPGPIDELQTFFELNPQIKTFATDVATILANRDTFKNSSGKWNVLSVRFGENTRREHLPLSRDLLNELHERGVFKQLHLFFDGFFEIDEVAAHQLKSFNGHTKLFIANSSLSSLPIPISVKHLCIGMRMETNFATLAKNIVNVEIIEFDSKLLFDEILPFILHSPKLNTIVIHWVDMSFKVDENDLEIEKLNKERSKLTKARKITIYASEEFYLTAKWKTNETSLSFIEIKRLESYNAFEYHIS